MKRSRESQLDYESRLALRILLPNVWTDRDKKPDVGIEIEIKIVEAKEATKNGNR